MTRKHFQQFASYIKEEKKHGSSEETLDALAKMVAAVGNQFNPNFSYDRFMTACGLED